MLFGVGSIREQVVQFIYEISDMSCKMQVETLTSGKLKARIHVTSMLTAGCVPGSAIVPGGLFFQHGPARISRSGRIRRELEEVNDTRYRGASQASCAVDASFVGDPSSCASYFEVSTWEERM